MKQLGLIGFPLGHSFSKKYYLEKFRNEGIKNIDYDLYPLSTIEEFPSLYLNNPEFYGVNVTIPYKQDVMQYLTELSEEAKEIAAVNCIQIRHEPDGVKLKGFNTDAYGFEKSLEPLLKPNHSKALIFGNGGATKAVAYSLKKLGIEYKIVSRTKTEDNLSYEDLTEELIQNTPLLINCTPLGTFPKTEECPALPYYAISSEHLLYDLIYNPEETLFLKKGKEKGAAIKNGYEMLVLQAEKNWEIWNQ
ncbi:shikimate dehydrogenase family protein [Sphingobacterium mizutaii]|uniref:shikimate dehydrogenase family protein n=1 Tax=Sphingobacterium mizutaii TaxID=1010 RepID=UPI0016247817|nr:shikimate dehydrogenase [Sphingobacterium mizutaii]